jgi:hypothetical protein
MSIDLRNGAILWKFLSWLFSLAFCALFENGLSSSRFQEAAFILISVPMFFLMATTDSLFCAIVSRFKHKHAGGDK